MVFRIAEYYDNYPETENYEPQSEDGEAQEVDEIDEAVEKRRKMAVRYGKSFKRYDWNSIVGKYISYVEPDDADSGYIMGAEGEDDYVAD